LFLAFVFSVCFYRLFLSFVSIACFSGLFPGNFPGYLLRLFWKNIDY